MAIPNISSHVTMSSNTNSSASKAGASRLGLNKNYITCKIAILVHAIIQRAEMTITKIPRTDNPTGLQTTMTSAIGSPLGVPTTTRLTIGVINVDNTEQQPAPAEARASLRLTQAQQYSKNKTICSTIRTTSCSSREYSCSCS
eukprot:5193908-Amphidinium_carterae.2